MKTLSAALSFSTFLFLALTTGVVSAEAAIEPNQIRGALPKKTESYMKEGLFTGGEREIRAGLIKNIRRATNAGFERVVIDIDAEKAPYYQVAVEGSEHRILVTIFGGPRLGLNAKKVMAEFKKSVLIQSVEFFPKVEDDAWNFTLNLKTATLVEVFELAAPTRIIFDLKGAGKVSSPVVSDGVRNAAPRAREKVRTAVPAHSAETSLTGSHSPAEFEEVPE